MNKLIVTVVGATGALGGHIIEAMLERGAHVRAMVRATSDRTRLEALGLTDLVVAALNAPLSLRRAVALQPAATAVSRALPVSPATRRRQRGCDARDGAAK